MTVLRFREKSYRRKERVKRSREEVLVRKARERKGDVSAHEEIQLWLREKLLEEPDWTAALVQRVVGAPAALDLDEDCPVCLLGEEPPWLADTPYVECEYQIVQRGTQGYKATIGFVDVLAIVHWGVLHAVAEPVEVGVETVPESAPPVAAREAVLTRNSTPLVFEVKSHIGSAMEVLQQVKLYREYLLDSLLCDRADLRCGDPARGVPVYMRTRYLEWNCEWLAGGVGVVVVSPDDQFKDLFEAEGIVFVKYPEGA